MQSLHDLDTSILSLAGLIREETSKKFLTFSQTKMQTTTKVLAGSKHAQEQTLHTIDMCKSTKYSTGAIARLLYIIALGGFVDFRVKLLFCSSVTVLTGITTFTIRWFTPLISMFYTRAWCGPVK